jgi:murein DD-endopeptidase MepM/ murein hydrolase activator NlpD
MTRMADACTLALVLSVNGTLASAQGPPQPTRTPSVRVVDLEIGETSRVVLADGSRVNIRLDAVAITTDPVRLAVREAQVTVTVNGQSVTIQSGNYELPRTLGTVQVDCPVVSALRKNSTEDSWGLDKAARLRLWPANWPWIETETFVYPVRQKWFASMTQMANEPVHVDGGEVPGNPKIYYHSGLDIGGAEGLVKVIAATDGLVVASGTNRLNGYEASPVNPRYDVVYLLDDRGWYYRYSHLQSIDPAIKLGASVKKAQRLGVLGKEGGSGGWSHLHFEVKSRQPSGKWGTQEGYAFLWQSAEREQALAVIAVARPHRFARVGAPVVLDGSKSWCRSGPPARFEWMLSDGSRANGSRIEKVYAAPGTYSETLKVADAEGHVAYDFAIVQVIDPARPDVLPPTIHAAFAPSFGLKAGDAVTFKVRTFRVGQDGGHETWDFGDGTPPASVQSDGNAREHAPDGYAATTHRFTRAGDYLVKVERANKEGLKAAARLHVRVD